MSILNKIFFPFKWLFCFAHFCYIDSKDWIVHKRGIPFLDSAAWEDYFTPSVWNGNFDEFHKEHMKFAFYFLSGEFDKDKERILKVDL